MGTFGAWTIVGSVITAPATKPLDALTTTHPVPMASGANSSGSSLDAFPTAALNPKLLSSPPARPNSSGSSVDAFPSALAAAAAARAHAIGSGPLVDAVPVAMAAAAPPVRANNSGASLDAFPEQAMGVRLDGNGSFAWQALDAVRSM